MHISDLTVEVRDKELNRLGQIPLVDLNLLGEDQFNNVGSWTIEIRSDHPMAEPLRQPGAGIIVSDSNGETLMSGPVTLDEAKSTIQDPGGTLVIDGVTDTVILADRLAFPDPTNSDPTTQTKSHDVRTGTAESLMHEYVAWNIGPLADPSRRDPRLQMGANGNRGASLTKRARFPVLGNLLNELALGENLGFRVIQVDDHLEFQTYAVADRTTDVRFDIYNNMLSGHTVQTAPPGVTRAIVAGQGDLVDRQFVEVTSSESLAAETLWGRRIEQFIDQRQTNDLAELTKAGRDALTEGGFAQLGVQVVPMEDMGTAEYGHSYKIGDTVTVVVENVEMFVPVTGYVLKKDKDGTRFGLILGNPNGPSEKAEVTAKVSKLETRVSNLERNAEGGSTGTDSGGGFMYWNGIAYVAAPDARHYIGPADPSSFGAVADGSVWDEVAV